MFRQLFKKANVGVRRRYVARREVRAEFMRVRRQLWNIFFTFIINLAQLCRRILDSITSEERLILFKVYNVAKDAAITFASLWENFIRGEMLFARWYCYPSFYLCSLKTRRWTVFLSSNRQRIKLISSVVRNNKWLHFTACEMISTSSKQVDYCWNRRSWSDIKFNHPRVVQSCDCCSRGKIGCNLPVSWHLVVPQLVPTYRTSMEMAFNFQSQVFTFYLMKDLSTVYNFSYPDLNYPHFHIIQIVENGSLLSGWLNYPYIFPIIRTTYDIASFTFQEYL